MTSHSNIACSSANRRVRLTEAAAVCAIPPASNAYHLRDWRALEAAAEVAKHTAEVVVIAPGFNTDKSVYYPADTLARAVEEGVFEGAQMFLNHGPADQADPSYDRDIGRYVAVLSGVHLRQTDGAILGTAKIVDDPFAQKLANFKQHNVLPQMGVSINAYADMEEREVEGFPTRVALAFTKCVSVDFTPKAGAGGEVLFFEARHVEAFDALTFRTRYPEIASAIVREAEKETHTMKTIQELEAEVARLTEALGKETAAREAAETTLAAREAAIKEAEQAAAKTATAAAIDALVSEAQLPDAAKARLRMALTECADPEQAKAMIAQEAEYVAALTTPATPPVVPVAEAAKGDTGEPRVTGLGKPTTGSCDGIAVVDAAVREAKHAQFLRECNGDERRAAVMTAAYFRG